MLIPSLLFAFADFPFSSWDGLCPEVPDVSRDTHGGQHEGPPASARSTQPSLPFHPPSSSFDTSHHTWASYPPPFSYAGLRPSFAQEQDKMYPPGSFCSRERGLKMEKGAMILAAFTPSPASCSNLALWSSSQTRSTTHLPRSPTLSTPLQLSLSPQLPPATRLGSLPRFRPSRRLGPPSSVPRLPRARRK